MSLREPTLDDAAAIAAYLNAHGRARFGEDELDEREVREWFGLPRIRMWLAERDGAIVGYADAAEEHGRWNVDARTLEPAVAPLLLAAAEAHAGPGATVRGYAAAADEPMVASYRAAGFTPVRHSFQMRIEVAGDEQAPEWPDGVTVRTLADGEEPRVHEVHMEAFADHWDFHPTPYDEWRRWFRDRETFDRTLWFLAEADGELAGLALCNRHPSGDPTFGWVEVLAVRRPWRRRGLGLALLRHAFAGFARRGATRVGLGVDAENLTGAVRLYERAGMSVVRRYDTWEKQT